MKLKTICFVVILIIACIFLINLSFNKKTVEEFKPLELNVGDTFTYLDYGSTMYVINYGIDDVTGDTENDMVILVGEKESVDSLIANKVDVVVYDTKNDNFIKCGLKGYSR